MPSSLEKLPFRSCLGMSHPLRSHRFLSIHIPGPAFGPHERPLPNHQLLEFSHPGPGISHGGRLSPSRPSASCKQARGTIQETFIKRAAALKNPDLSYPRALSVAPPPGLCPSLPLPALLPLPLQRQSPIRSQRSLKLPMSKFSNRRGNPIAKTGARPTRLFILSKGNRSCSRNRQQVTSSSKS
jgi:hypothetical protein